MTWELIHSCLLHPSDSATKEMFHHQTLTEIPKKCPKKTTSTPFTFCYKPKTTILTRGTKVDTFNLQPGEFLYLELILYNITYIHGFIKFSFLFVFRQECSGSPPPPPSDHESESSSSS